MVEEFRKEKMERLDMNSSDNQTGKGSLKDSSEPGNCVTESKACPDLHKDLTDLTSQVQMMSDSLAACKQMSRYRPLRKAFDGAAGATPQTSRQALPPAGKASPPSAWGKDATTSYTTGRTEGGKQLQRWNAAVSLESVSDGDLNAWSERPGQRRGRLQRTPEAQHMADLIRKELETLVHLAPSVSLLAAILSDTVFRYTDCRKCSKRISSLLPWILNRIQELIVYVAARRKETCSYGCLRLEPTEGEIKKSVEEEKADSGSVLPLEEPAPTEIAKSEKVDVSAEVRPGLQILLQVKPEKQKKRFFQTAGRQPPQTQVNRCFVQIHEAACVPVVHVVKPRRQPQLLEETKREVLRVQECSFGFCLLFRYCTRTPASVLQPTPVGTAIAVQKARETLSLKAVVPIEERKLQWKKNSLTVLTKKTSQTAPAASRVEEKKVPSQEISGASLRGLPEVSCQKETTRPGEKSSCRYPSQRKPPRRGSNERRSYDLSEFLANAPDTVKELLREAEEEKMEIKKLEVDVNGLKDLMLEVHKNQIELSRFLLENGIYSQPIIKLTNPQMLEEESAALRKLEEALAGNRSRSVESLQEEIEELRERCIMKNKMVVSLVKGLQSDVPHEWWEEMLGEARPSEEINYERFSELYQNISFFLTNSEQASKKTPLAEEQPSEEEPMSKGKVGADLKEDLIGLSFGGGNVAKAKAEDLQEWQSQCRIWAFPVNHFPKGVNTSILKLENQISVLNVENEKLWQEVHELKDQLAGSIKELGKKRQFTVVSSERLPVTEKTINLTIQIATEKMAPSSTNAGFLNKSDGEDAGSQESLPGTARSSPAVHSTDVHLGGRELQREDSGLLTTKPKFHLKSSHFVDDVSPTASKSGEPRKSEAFARGVSQLVQPVLVSTPRPLGRSFLQPRAGPSGSRADCAFRKPSPAEGQSPEAHASERPLLPILENAGSPTSSEAIGQTIQRLRTRVRSIHKEVAMLKLKNVRIEKLLDRLMDDAVYNNNRSLEETQTNLQDLSSRLGYC